MRIAIGLNSSWNLINFRSGLIRALIQAGHEVVAIAPEDKYSERVRQLGCDFVGLSMTPNGRNPLQECVVLLRYIFILRKLKPEVFLAFTVKPNIYGSIAARLSGATTINNVAGLGIAFKNRTLFTIFIEKLYRFALSSSAMVFFQNDEDMSLFVSRGIVSAGSADRLPGSGVDLSAFPFAEIGSRSRGGAFRFILIARMLWSKGVGEYVQAARIVKKRFKNVEFCLLGFKDVSSPDAIPSDVIDAWVASGDVVYLGSTDSVCEQISLSHCVVLPSYYPEGVPRSLLESAAVGRPIITTDTPGCREVVIDGENGYLCKAQDAFDLSEKIALMLDRSADQLDDMGRRSRRIAETRFDERLVISRYVAAIGVLS